MFLIKNNRLCYGDVSFVLPSGLQLKLCVDNRVTFQPTNGAFTIEFLFSEYGGTAAHYAEVERQMFLDNSTRSDITPIQAIVLYGRQGFSFSYHNQMNLYFDIMSGMHLYATVESSVYDIETVLQKAEVKELFQSIKMDLEDELENIASGIGEITFDQRDTRFLQADFEAREKAGLANQAGTYTFTCPNCNSKCIGSWMWVGEQLHGKTGCKTCGICLMV